VPRQSGNQFIECRGTGAVSGGPKLHQPSPDVATDRLWRVIGALDPAKGWHTGVNYLLRKCAWYVIADVANCLTES